MDGLCACVLVAVFACKCYGDYLGFRSWSDEIDGGIFHCELAADVCVDPFDAGVFVGVGSLGDEVVDVRRPVLEGCITDPSSFLRDDLDDCGVKGVCGVDWGCAAFDVLK